MRIQHNILAMNAYRNYNANTSALAKNLEKLSSGYRINRAGDDAAGLAISEKMRAQITGLNAAQKNVKDGISLVKTAEGAMQEIQDMLNRMDYLATQSANGTYDDPVDRVNLQKEVTALKSEIDRIADSANFNGIKLLNGNLDEAAAQAQVDAATAQLVAAGSTDVTVTAEKDGVFAPADQKGKYTIDLSKLQFKNDTGAAVNANGVKVSFGSGLEIANTATIADKGTLSGKDLVDQWFTGITNAGVAAGTKKVTFSGIDFDATNNNDGTVTLVMQKDPSAITGFAQPSFSSTVTDGTNSNNQADAVAVRIEEEAVVGGTRKYAQGSFTLTAADIKDGATLTIGKDTYTFKVGKNSTVAAGNNVIDLSDYEEGATDIEKFAAKRLTKVAESNEWFKVTNNNNSGVIKLTEKEGAFADYKTYDLAGTTGSTTDGDWTGLVKLGSAISQEDIDEAISESGKDKLAGKLTLQIGDTSEIFNQLQVKVGDMHVSAMGFALDAEGKITTDGNSISDVDISTQKGAQDAIATIKNAINYVSGVRGDLGATQNRLEHTANNLSVMAENIQDAESTIRDTDVAEEMMAYTKNNILVQAAQAMLAQANAVPQGVLQLLQ